MDCDKHEPLGRLIYHTAQEIKNLAERILKPSDLTLEQFHLLKNMSLQSGLTQRQLGELASKTPANMTRILDRLESKSLIVRRDNPKDRRASLVFLTVSGESLVHEVFEVLESFSARISYGISEKDKETVKKVLAAIAANIQTMNDTIEPLK